MALFKISKGKSTDLGIKNGTNKTTEGYAYFTPDDGKFYIDIATANTVELGTNRIVLNSFKADLSQSFTVNLTERSSFWTLNIPGLKELKEGLILHISIPTRPNDVYNVLNINGLGNKLIYYRYNEPLGDNIQIPAELTLIYKDNLSSFDQVFTNENNQNIPYGQSGWVVDSAYSINKSDIYYGNLAGNAATATQLFHTPNHQDVFLRGDNTWTNKIIGDLNITDNIITNNINANQITPINNSFMINGNIVTNGLFTIGNKDFSQIYTGQENNVIGNKTTITNLNYSSYFEELSIHELYPWSYDTENNYWNILNTQGKNSLYSLLSGSWRALSNFALNINIKVYSEEDADYLIIRVNDKEQKRVSGDQTDNITLFLKTNDVVDFIIQKDHSYTGPDDIGTEFYQAILSYQQYTSAYNITVNKNFVPENNQQTLGTIENKWDKLYIGSKETYGSISQPIYWNDGVPTGITTLGIEYGGTNATSFTNNNLIIYNNSQLQSFEAEADSKGKYLKSQGADKPPIWSELSITLNGAATDSPSFYAPIDCGDGSEYYLVSGGYKKNNDGSYTYNPPVWSELSITLNHSVTTSPDFYAPTDCGDGQGYFLVSGGQQRNNDGSYTYNPPTWSKILIDYNHIPKNLEEEEYYYLIGSDIQPLVSNATPSQPMISELYAHEFAKINSSGHLFASKVYNAVWNDYAEYRQTNDIQPGKVYQENDNGCMTLTNQRLIPGCSIASDTFGSAMGKTLDAQTPMAVAGRVLAYTYQNRSLYHAGMAVCSAPNGTIDIMSREEIIAYPDCIIGYVSEIPEYEEWGSGHVQVDGRIWIKIK